MLRERQRGRKHQGRGQSGREQGVRYTANPKFQYDCKGNLAKENQDREEQRVDFAPHQRQRDTRARGCEASRRGAMEAWGLVSRPEIFTSLQSDCCRTAIRTFESKPPKLVSATFQRNMPHNEILRAVWGRV